MSYNDSSKNPKSFSCGSVNQYKKIKNYWNERAKESKIRCDNNSTTNDFHLKTLEINKLKEVISKIKEKKIIADIGCGDGFSTIEIASSFPNSSFIGYDYSAEMIEYANKRKKEKNITNVKFKVMDITQDISTNKFDVIYTDRCIINLPDWKTQIKAIKNILSMLKKDGILMMIENFKEGNDNFNKLRKAYNLPEIPVRWHNYYLEKNRTIEFLNDYGTIELFKNIASSYYIVSRIIYSSICAAENKEPDYLDIHHKLAYELPSCGDFSPIYMVVLRKNNYCTNADK